MNFSLFPQLETKRLLLRQMHEHDAWQMYRLRINDRVVQYLDTPKMPSEEEARKYIFEINNKIQKGRAAIWALTKAGFPDEMIGTLGYHEIISKHFRAEVRFMLHPDYHAQGYMTEALSVVLVYGFEKLGLQRVEAQTNPLNKAATALLRKHDFLQEALFVEHHYFNERFFDTAVFALLKRRFHQMY